jgi:GntR family transcriptional repressor for pyruvate dehydrogenase complex
MDRMFNVARKPKASEEARSLIVDLIRTGQLKVGDQLPSEARMAEQMGISRVPVREAVSGLAHVGLLRVKRGSGGGIFVAEPTVEPFGEFFSLMLTIGKASVRELTEARLLIEPGTAALAAQNATPEQIERLRQTIVEYRSAVRQNRLRSVKDVDFHIVLAEASHNIVLEMLVKGLVPLLFRSVSDLQFEPADRIKGIHGHEKVLAAVEAGNAEAARKAMYDHVKRMADYWKPS